MGTTVEDVKDLAHQVQYRQTISPTYQYGSFTADDADNHDFKVDGRGKGRFTVAVDNPANQSLTFAVYGMHSATGTVGGTGVHQIGTTTTVSNASTGYEVVADPFPWYLIRVVYGGVPTDSPLKTCTVNIDFSSF
ncbi:MAG: hypothetical protein PHQ43_00150 [Dehalococcoidales bacterium]|nr:hypothetical protein [Dehalococcoidales bacterium]